jgi:hypothetical protein
VSERDLSRYSTPSTGDPAEDRRVIERHAKHEELMRRGRCPNDDGDLVQDRDGDDVCNTCGFIRIMVPLYVGRADA